MSDLDPKKFYAAFRQADAQRELREMIRLQEEARCIQRVIDEQITPLREGYYRRREEWKQYASLKLDTEDKDLLDFRRGLFRQMF